MRRLGFGQVGVCLRPLQSLQGNRYCLPRPPSARFTARMLRLNAAERVVERRLNAKFWVCTARCGPVDGAAMSYAKGRLAEAYTGASKTTDLGFSYTNRGEVATAYQSSPHSSGYYHIAATYWAPQGLLDVLTSNMGSSIPNWTYAPDGEGRVNTTKSGSQSFGPTYSASTNRYTAIGTVTPTYDNNGNLTYDGFYHYTWDGEGKLATLGG